MRRALQSATVSNDPTGVFRTGQSHVHSPHIVHESKTSRGTATHAGDHYNFLLSSLKTVHCGYFDLQESLGEGTTTGGHRCSDLLNFGCLAVATSSSSSDRGHSGHVLFSPCECLSRRYCSRSQLFLQQLFLFRIECHNPNLFRIHITTVGKLLQQCTEHIHDENRLFHVA